MKFGEMQKKNSEELEALEQNFRKELSDASLLARGGQLRQTSKPKNIRGDIARVLTVKRQRQLEKGR